MVQTSPTATKILQDLLYVRKRFAAETSEQIKGHSVLSKVIDYFRDCSKYEEEQAALIAAQKLEGKNNG